ncbi:hypothetical protein CAPTEDRAFT_202568 [Capitella teleta]|uniref:CUB domain-containing protein n=1 Tax=Capitella teleta TaxID=283909 RepID=R7VBR3_CAPTE|nr:hypothetical protein CAPTEDRAFT_202568 [Capitella teleta]|eukprot:ELU13130.1 hypothetical protein CAPTEDRAFT_202568 [Capitella teleta]
MAAMVARSMRFEYRNYRSPAYPHSIPRGLGERKAPLRILSKMHDKKQSWSSLVYDYTQETTLHGLRYTTLSSGHIVRRAIWAFVLLGAVALFLYLVVEKVEKLQSHPKAVNVEVTYNESLMLTKLQENGLYDLFVDVYPSEYSSNVGNKTETSTGECEERYSLHKGICGIPDLEAYSRTPISTVRGSWAWVIKETTRAVCQNLCSDIYSSACSSVLYITSARECVLSSYSGSLPGLPCNDTAYDDFEFFRRRRCAAQLKLLCNYDSNTDCPLKDDQTANDTWTVVLSQEASNPSKDNTLSSGSGSYTHLLETANRPNYTARMYADYYNTTGLCMGFAYAFMGYDQTKIRLFSIQEDKVENTISTIEYTTTYRNSEVLWHYYKAELPEGINMIMIEGKRGGYGSSGAALDDIEVKQCHLFQEPCISTRLGLGYLGKESKTASGQTCVRWSDFVGWLNLSPDNIPDRTWNDAENYCRSIANAEVFPSCATSLDFYLYGDYLEPCAIPYCPCSDSQFTCDNGFCLSKSLTCNGVDDCGDSSDEAHVCASISKATCEFKNDFMCGYKVQAVDTFEWLRVQGDYESIAPDYGSEGPGYMMLLKSNDGLPGDGSLLTSKIINVTTEQTIRFDAYYNPDNNDATASLSVDLSFYGIKRIHLFSVPNDYYWNTYYARAPAGEYQIVFSANNGQALSENIAIGDVQLSSSPVENQTYAEAYIATKFDCNFNEGDCTYSEESESTVFRWQRIPSIYLETYFKLNDLVTTDSLLWLQDEGNITSVNYPSSYKNNYQAEYIIVGRPGSSIEITLVHFDTESCCDKLRVGLCRKVFAENGGVLDDKVVLSGRHTDERYLFITEMLVMRFGTDISLQYTGFHISFKITPQVTHTDYGLLGGLSGSTLKDVRTTTLVSPIVTLNGIHCVEATLYSATELSIEKREYKQSIETLKRCFSYPFGFGRTWQTLRFNASGSSLSALTFTAHISDKTALIQTLAVAVKEVKTSPASSVTDISCKFDDVTQCNYLDVSESQVAWTRAESKGLCEIYTANDYVMNTVFTSSERRTARIMTPKVNFSPGCLIVDTMLISNNLGLLGDLTLFALRDSGPDLLLHVDLNPDATWAEIEAALPAGVYSVLFVFFPKLTSSESSEYGMLWLGDLRVTTSACVNPTDVNSANTTSVNPTSTGGSTGFTTDLPTTTPPPQLPESVNLGPELNYYEQLNKLEMDIPMAEISEKLAHKLDDMLYSCKWNGLADNCDDFEPQPTDAGYCYTYNGQEHNVIRTKRTGADLGLQLVLNIEEYQYVDFLDQIDSGFKVHLHAQYEIPSVSSSGFGVSPGTHALASVTYTKTHSLQPPWGECSSIPLINSDRYTRLRCGLECLTNATIDECQCQESYMTAPVFEAREACELKCPDACDVVTQPVSLSYTGLSGDSVLNSMTRSQLKTLTDSYFDAKTLSDRVKGGSMTKTTRAILNVNQKYLETSDFISSKIRNTHTSVIYRVVKAMSSYVNMSQTDINVNMFQSLSAYIKQYSNGMESAVKDMKESLLPAMSLISSFTARLRMKCEDGQDTEGPPLNEIPDLFYSTLQDPYYKYDTYLQFYEFSDVISPNRYRINFTELTNGNFYASFKYLKDLQHHFTSGTDNDTSLDPIQAVCDSDLYDIVISELGFLYSEMSSYSNAITNYEDFLNELAYWKYNLYPLNVTTNLEGFGDTFHQSYLSTTEHLGTLLRDYGENKTSKRELAESIIDMNLDELNENNTLTLNEFKTDVIAALKAEAKTFSSTLITDYQKGVDYLKQLSNFFRKDSENFINLAQSVSLWLQPYPVIETQNIIVYRLRFSELYKVWPDSTSLEGFVDDIAPPLITDTTKNYFDNLIKMLTDVEVDTEQGIKELTSAINELQHFCNQYLEETTIDGAFINKNFLRLDIYFGELKYESVEQKRDYDIGTLFSEIGGYMGLLIGGSAITIVEFLDLIIYNCFLKGHGKKKSVTVVKPIM